MADIVKGKSKDAISEASCSKAVPQRSVSPHVNLKARLEHLASEKLIKDVLEKLTADNFDKLAKKVPQKGARPCQLVVTRLSLHWT